MICIQSAAMHVRKKLSRKTNGQGCCCTFVPLTDDVGVKCYYEKETRDTCYRRQQMAESHGLAPRTGETFEISVLIRRMVWEWQEPEIEKGQFYDDPDWKDWRPGMDGKRPAHYRKGRHVQKITLCRVYCFTTERVTTREELEKTGYLEISVEGLRQAFKAVGMEAGDLHSGNIGFNADGMVVIDFSHFGDDCSE